MTLRPALSALHPTPPKPREIRRVACPQCGHGFEISQRAVSVRCPACTRPLEFKDVTLRQRVEGDVQTMGQVALEPAGEMIGRLICGELQNRGRFEGRAMVYGAVDLAPGSLTTGEISGRSLNVGWGATLRARATIGLKPKVSPTARLLSYRPLRRITRRPFTASPAPLATIAAAAPSLYPTTPAPASVSAPRKPPSPTPLPDPGASETPAASRGLVPRIAPRIARIGGTFIRRAG